MYSGLHTDSINNIPLYLNSAAQSIRLNIATCLGEYHTHSTDGENEAQRS